MLLSERHTAHVHLERKKIIERKKIKGKCTWQARITMLLSDRHTAHVH